MSSPELRFAREFLRHRIRGHRKDVAICMRGYQVRPNSKLTHAYFPALMITIGFAELLSSLHAGKIEYEGRNKLQLYFDDFMDRHKYPKEAVDVLYEGFRHKIAHLGHPYAIFDSKTKPKIFPSPKRYAWTVYAKVRPQPLYLEHHSAPKRAVKPPLPPWSVDYDSRIHVSVRSLSKDLVGSIFRTAGFFSRLESDTKSLRRFMDCMEEFYPR